MRIGAVPFGRGLEYDAAMLGSHLSIAGGLHNALVAGRALRVDCVQVFTKNQQQWSSPPLTDAAVRLWREHLASTGIARTVSHDSYLINLASPDADLRRRSAALFREELLRCEALGIPHLVAHPGAHMGAGEAEGLRRVAESLDAIHRGLPGLRTVTCLEVTAGQGTSLGWRLEHLREIMDRVREPHRVGVCLDTAHLLAAGYALTSAAGAAAVLEEVDGVIGLQRVHVVHVNDSKVPRGRRVDRHEHIGHGHIPKTAFRVVLNHPSLARVPKILETPKTTAPDGRAWDEVNLETLRALLARPRCRAACKPGGARA